MNNKVEAKVITIMEGGTCPRGHKVGDRWVFAGVAPGGLCASAVSTLFPMVQVLRFGATPSYSKEEGVARLCCSDPANPVVFELRRLEEPIG